MTDLESAEAFVSRLALGLGCRVTPDFEAQELAAAQAMVAARDRAIRAAALEAAADLLQRNAGEAYGYSNAGRDRALCAGLAKSIRALATKEPADG